MICFDPSYKAEFNVNVHMIHENITLGFLCFSCACISYRKTCLLAFLTKPVTKVFVSPPTATALEHFLVLNVWPC
jgi:hypothetical protein